MFKKAVSALLAFFIPLLVIAPLNFKILTLLDCLAQLSFAKMVFFPFFFKILEFEDEYFCGDIQDIAELQCYFKYWLGCDNSV